MEGRIAKLETEMRHVLSAVDEIRTDMRTVRDTIVGAKWAGRALVGLVGILGVLGGWALRVWSTS